MECRKRSRTMECERFEPSEVQARLCSCFCGREREREREEREAMALRRDERERRKGRNWTPRGGRERRGRCGGENLRHVEEKRTGFACALDARTKGTCTVRRKTGDTAKEERTRGGRGG